MPFWKPWEPVTVQQIHKNQQNKPEQKLDLEYVFGTHLGHVVFEGCFWEGFRRIEIWEGFGTNLKEF